MLQESPYNAQIHMSPATDPAEAKADHLLMTIIFYDCFH